MEQTPPLDARNRKSEEARRAMERIASQFEPSFSLDEALDSFEDSRDIDYGGSDGNGRQIPVWMREYPPSPTDRLRGEDLHRSAESSAEAMKEPAPNEKAIRTDVSSKRNKAEPEHATKSKKRKKKEKAVRPAPPERKRAASKKLAAPREDEEEMPKGGIGARSRPPQEIGPVLYRFKSLPPTTQVSLDPDPCDRDDGGAGFEKKKTAATEDAGTSDRTASTSGGKILFSAPVSSAASANSDAPVRAHLPHPQPSLSRESISPLEFYLAERIRLSKHLIPLDILYERLEQCIAEWTSTREWKTIMDGKEWVCPNTFAGMECSPGTETRDPSFSNEVLSRVGRALEEFPPDCGYTQSEAASKMIMRQGALRGGTYYASKIGAEVGMAELDSNRGYVRTRHEFVPETCLEHLAAIDSRAPSKKGTGNEKEASDLAQRVIRSVKKWKVNPPDAERSISIEADPESEDGGRAGFVHGSFREVFGVLRHGSIVDRLCDPWTGPSVPLVSDLAKDPSSDNVILWGSWGTVMCNKADWRTSPYVSSFVSRSLARISTVSLPSPLGSRSKPGRADVSAWIYSSEEDEAAAWTEANRSPSVALDAAQLTERKRAFHRLHGRVMCAWLSRAMKRVLVEQFSIAFPPSVHTKEIITGVRDVLIRYVHFRYTGLDRMRTLACTYLDYLFNPGMWNVSYAPLDVDFSGKISGPASNFRHATRFIGEGAVTREFASRVRTSVWKGRNDLVSLAQCYSATESQDWIYDLGHVYAASFMRQFDAGCIFNNVNDERRTYGRKYVDFLPECIVGDVCIDHPNVRRINRWLETMQESGGSSMADGEETGSRFVLRTQPPDMYGQCLRQYIIDAIFRAVKPRKTQRRGGEEGGGNGAETLSPKDSTSSGDAFQAPSPSPERTEKKPRGQVKERIDFSSGRRTHTPWKVYSSVVRFRESIRGVAVEESIASPVRSYLPKKSNATKIAPEIVDSDAAGIRVRHLSDPHVAHELIDLARLNVSVERPLKGRALNFERSHNPVKGERFPLGFEKKVAIGLLVEWHNANAKARRTEDDYVIACTENSVHAIASQLFRAMCERRGTRYFPARESGFERWLAENSSSVDRITERFESKLRKHAAAYSALQYRGERKRKRNDKSASAVLFSPSDDDGGGDPSSSEKHSEGRSELDE